MAARPVATTDAEKKLRCCQYYELMKEVTSTLGKATLKQYKEGYGLDLKLKSYTKICQADYPAAFKGYAKSPSKWDAAKHLATTDPDSGSIEYKTYCDGGAQALAVAAAAAAAITVSLY